MSREPYTYVSMSLHGRDRAQLNVSFHTPRIRLENLVIQGTRPLLSMSTPEADVSISTTGGGPVTDQDLAVARALLDAATCYLADCERLHAIESSDQAAA
ncbi:hypothetical protein [Nonomuraea sp. NPDC003201]